MVTAGENTDRKRSSLQNIPGEFFQSLSLKKTLLGHIVKQKRVILVLEYCIHFELFSFSYI